MARPMSVGKETGQCTDGSQRSTGTKRLSKDCRANVGKDQFAAGADSNLQGLFTKGDQRWGEGTGLAHESVRAMTEG